MSALISIVNAAYYGITTICGIYFVSSIYKMVKFNEYIDYLQSNQQPTLRSEIYKIEDYENEFDEGYDCASEEFLNQCNTSMKSIMDYTDKNLQILATGEKLDTQYVKGALALLVLPKWTLMVNEVPYIVRATPKSLWTTAWSEGWKPSTTNYTGCTAPEEVLVIEENSSKELDEKLREVVTKSIPNMTDTKIEHLQRLVRKNMYQVLDDLVSIHCHV